MRNKYMPGSTFETGICFSEEVEDEAMPEDHLLIVHQERSSESRTEDLIGDERGEGRTKNPQSEHSDQCLLTQHTIK